MNPSNDVSRDSNVDLTSPGAVTLDTTVVPDVFGLHTFDNRAPVVQVLPGDYSNMVRVLVPDGNAKLEFHDILVENLSNTPGSIMSSRYRRDDKTPLSSLFGKRIVRYTW